MDEPRLSSRVSSTGFQVYLRRMREMGLLGEGEDQQFHLLPAPAKAFLSTAS